MGLTSLQVCMDSSDWLQGTIYEEPGMDSSSPSGDMLTCSTPLIERRLRPQHDQALKCPRCDSTHTKFCYYNNYSLSQPRYFCKTCRRYWTKGGTLRNIPVGGGCRKNKKVSSSKKSSNDHHQSINHQNPISPSSSNINPIDLQLSNFPHEMQFSHLNNNFFDTKYNVMLENPTPIDFMESKFEALVGNSRNHNDHLIMGNGDQLGIISGIGEMGSQGMINGANNFHNFCTSPFGMSNIHGNSLMLPYESTHHGHHEDHENSTILMDVKPNPKALLSLEWHDNHQGCSDHAGKDSFGNYLNGMGSSWPGLMNGYGSSATNPLF